MRIVIVGAGEVGTHLAKMLATQEHDTYIIDSDSEKLRKLNDECEIQTICGSPTSVHDLIEARVENADLFVAVTPHESQNITACMLAYNLGAKYRIARIDNGEYLEERCAEFFKKMGIDQMIYPELLAANEIKTFLKKTWARQWMEFGNGNLILIAMILRSKAKILNKKLKDLTTSGNYRVVAIRRDAETIIPNGNTEIKEKDIVYFITTRNHVEHVKQEAGKEENDVKDVMILGGTKMAIRTCKVLCKEKLNIKLLEKDPERAKRLSETLDAMVINTDGSDPEVLIQEDIEDMDAFVALSDNSDANIMACLQAKKMGISKAIADVEKMSYIQLAERLDIGNIINKKLITASYIYQHTLDASVSTVTSLMHVDAEVVELTAQYDSPITTNKIMEIEWPKNVFVGGYIRDNVGEIANGNTQIKSGDRVIVFCPAKSLRTLSKIFNSK